MQQVIIFVVFFVIGYVFPPRIFKYLRHKQSERERERYEAFKAIMKQPVVKGVYPYQWPPSQPLGSLLPTHWNQMGQLQSYRGTEEPDGTINIVFDENGKSIGGLRPASFDDSNERIDKMMNEPLDLSHEDYLSCQSESKDKLNDSKETE